MNNTTRRQRLTPSTKSLPKIDDNGANSELTQEQIKDWHLLRSTWDLHRRLGRKLNAKKMSLDAGLSQSAASQYLNGRQALNTGAKLWFASELRMAPHEIWPDWKYRAMTHSPGLVRLGEAWGKLQISTRDAINDLIDKDEAESRSSAN